MLTALLFLNSTVCTEVFVNYYQVVYFEASSLVSKRVELFHLVYCNSRDSPSPFEVDIINVGEFID